MIKLVELNSTQTQTLTIWSLSKFQCKIQIKPFSSNPLYKQTNKQAWLTLLKNQTSRSWHNNMNTNASDNKKSIVKMSMQRNLTFEDKQALWCWRKGCWEFCYHVVQDFGNQSIFQVYIAVAGHDMCDTRKKLLTFFSHDLVHRWRINEHHYVHETMIQTIM